MLTVQDPNVSISALLKLISGSQKMMDDLNIEEFTKQADLFEDLDEDLLSTYYKFRLIATQPFPFPASRAREMRGLGAERGVQETAARRLPAHGCGSGTAHLHQLQHRRGQHHFPLLPRMRHTAAASRAERKR